MKRLLIIVLLASCLSAQTAAPPTSLTLTREAVEKRIAELEQGKQQLIANLTATDGAIQENKIWLAKLKEAEEAATSNKPTFAPKGPLVVGPIVVNTKNGKAKP